MIDPKELRIGNIVDSPLSENPIQMADVDFTSAFLKLFTPIPLTEEWLLKFGFEKRRKPRWVKEQVMVVFTGEELKFYHYKNFAHFME
jgi:hypothetical protein